MLIAIFISLTLLCLNSRSYAAAFSIARCSKHDEKPVILQTTTGKVRGQCEHVRVKDEETLRDNNVYSWLGIPYAEAPVGRKRFLSPSPIQPWTNVLDARKWPNSCVQSENSYTQNAFDGYRMWRPNKNISSYSEDCLYLNIWMPADAYLRKNLRGGKYEKASIMVFMNDDELKSGTSALDVYDPSTFAALTGIVVITLNYRLGIFGFLHLEGHVNGNQALLDQNLALKWINANADKLGADRAKITIVGSTMASYHLLHKPSWHLFRNAILQSGSPFQTSLTPISSREGTRRALKFAEYLGCDTMQHEEVLSCLRTKNRFQLVKAADDYFLNHVLKKNEKSAVYLMTFFPPVIDGTVLHDLPVDQFKRSEYKKCSILTGFNANEGSLLLDKAELITFKRPNQIKTYNLARMNSFIEHYFYYFPTLPWRSTKTLTRAILDEYTHNITNRNFSVAAQDLNYIRILERILTHESQACSTLKLANVYSRQNKVYAYSYSHRISTSPWNIDYGVMRGDEMAMIFAQPVSIRSPDSVISPNPWLQFGNKTYSTIERDLCYKMINYWSNFIRNNDPNVQDNNSVLETKVIFSWPEFKQPTSQNKTKLLSIARTQMRILNNFAEEKCEFWDNLERRE